MSVVVHIVQRMAPGGIETLVLDLARSDPGVRVVSLDGDIATLVKAWPPLLDLSDRFIALGKSPGLVPKLIPRIARLLRDWRASAIVAHHVGPLLYGGLAARLAGIAVRVHVEHDSWHYQDQSRAKLGRLLNTLVNPRRVAVSRTTAEAASSALASSLFEIIPNGVDLDRFRPADQAQARRNLGLPQDRKLIGTVGRLTKVKGQDILVEAATYLGDVADIVLIGDGEEMSQLKSQAEALDVADRIHFLGHCDRPEAVYPAFDIFCLPSRAEGFPRALIEAQACDIPVVAADVGGVREAVCPQTGRLVPPENPLRLALGLAAALESRNAANPRAFVDPRFSFDRTVEAYRSIASARRSLLAS